MKTGLRVALVVVIVALYAFLLGTFLLLTFGPEELQSFSEALRGAKCTNDCSPRHLIGVTAIALPFIATWFAVVWVGVVWIRRRARRDRDLTRIDAWLATDPPVTQPDPPAEPEPQRFYRDRQGRLRPLKSVHDDD